VHAGTVAPVAPQTRAPGTGPGAKRQKLGI